MQDYTKIIVWQKSHNLVKDIYFATARFPNHELFGITSQIRRAAVSISANIVEGSGKRSNADFARFCQISYGSAAELEYLLFLSLDLEYLDETQHNELKEKVEEVKKMLSGLLKKLKTDN